MPYKTWLLAGCMLLMPWVAHAAGLGKLTILSALGQPLTAEIDLVSVQKDELSTLTVRLAAPEAFAKANIQYSPALIGVRLSVERRADGQPYIKIGTVRNVGEPFISLLVELSWAQGRLVREYTVLLDPPGFAQGAPAPVAPPVVTAIPPMAAPAPEEKPATPAASVTPTPPAVPTAAPATAPAKSASKEYTVKKGDTLVKIASGLKPAGVTLEQTLVGLYRSNPDAFSGNMNRLKTGKILRVPDQEQLTGTVQADAAKEVRVQAANWNAYRNKLADAAGETPARESKSAATGKITSRVDDKAVGKEAPKEVLKLSKGEPVAGAGAGGKPSSAAQRVRTLEEEATAREKSLAEANSRIAQLEKTIKDMQRLAEIKGQVPGAKPAPEPAKAKAEPAKAEPAKAEPAKIAKTEPMKDLGKEPAKEAPKEPAKDAGKGSATPPEPTQIDQKPAVVAEAAKAEAPKKVEPAPAPKPKVVAPPPPEPDLIDEITGNPAYLGGIGGGLLALGGAGYWFMRRRRAQSDDTDVEKVAPKLKSAKAAVEPPTPAAVAEIPAGPTAADDVDPLAEADLYLNFGRDAQAEEVLKEALEKNPKHEEAQLKLLQIYAGRKDKSAFEKVAKTLHIQTGGTSENWLKAAAIGYAFDPENALYEAGKSAPAAIMQPAAGAAPVAADLDFDLELAPDAGGITQTDVELDSGASKTVIMDAGELAGAMAGESARQTASDSEAARAAAGASPDFTIDAPETETVTSVEPDLTLDAPADDAGRTSVLDASAAPAGNMIDFNFDSPAAEPEPLPAADDKTFTHDGTVVLDPDHRADSGVTMDFNIGDTARVGDAAVAPAAVQEPEFSLDLGAEAPAAAPPMAPLMPDLKLDDLNLTLDDTHQTGAAADTAGGGGKDDRWYDVQTKFDLAKAYQEMGDKDGAREILQEVIKEGDAGQQAEAKSLLATLG